MEKFNSSKKNDRLLGLNQKIDRRDFLNSSLLGAGSILYSMSAPSMLFANESLPNQVTDNWYGYGGVGDSKTSHGNTPDILKAAHAVRDGLLNSDKAKNITAYYFSYFFRWSMLENFKYVKNFLSLLKK